MVRRIIRLFFLWSSVLCGAFFVAAWILPWWFDSIEAWQGAPLPYEGALRLYVLAAADFLFFGALAWLLVKGERRHWIFWSVAAFSYASLVVVFFLDRAHRLMEEFSWIRYTTSGFLFLAAFTAFVLAWQYWRERKAKGIFVVLWIVIGASLLYSGLDEVLEIHEAIGRFITTRAHLPSYVTDLVTMTYAVGTLVFIALFFRKFFAEYRERHSFFIILFVAGGVIYFVSTLFDTIDIFLLEKLRTLANVRAINPRFAFGDAWYMLWAPKNFFNGLEEVFEHTAATLFFSSFLLLLLEKRLTLGVEKLNTECCGPLRRWASHSIVVTLVLSVVISFALSVPDTFAKSPLVGNQNITRIAGYFDGLYHTDDLFYHPAWGVLVANEGRGNIYQWKNERWRMLPDPEKKLRDTDSVTAIADALFVSDGSKRTVFRYDEKEGFTSVWQWKEGQGHPEGIVAVNDVLFIVDESEKVLVRLTKGQEPLAWRPSHALWKAPEGIAYHPVKKQFIITDDVSGAVFLADPPNGVALLARLANPEDVAIAPDGRALVTDNGWGAVFAVALDGTLEKIAQFRRSYRDVQGIAVDEKKQMYVVTSNGFDNVSFMSSFLFRIILPPRI